MNWQKLPALAALQEKEHLQRRLSGGGAQCHTRNFTPIAKISCCKSTSVNLGESGCLAESRYKIKREDDRRKCCWLYYIPATGDLAKQPVLLPQQPLIFQRSILHSHRPTRQEL